jgi:hypothetical protein
MRWAILCHEFNSERDWMSTFFCNKTTETTSAISTYHLSPRPFSHVISNMSICSGKRAYVKESSFSYFLLYYNFYTYFTLRCGLRVEVHSFTLHSRLKLHFLHNHQWEWISLFPTCFNDNNCDLSKFEMKWKEK